MSLQPERYREGSFGFAAQSTETFEDLSHHIVFESMYKLGEVSEAGRR
jgi:hypothetical protein